MSLLRPDRHDLADHACAWCDGHGWIVVCELHPGLGAAGPPTWSPCLCVLEAAPDLDNDAVSVAN